MEEYESWAWSAPQKSFPFSGFSCPSMLAPSESWFMHDSSLIYGLRILSPEYCAKIFYLFLHSLRIILQFLGIQVVLCSSILFYSFVKCAKSWAVIQQYCSIANEVNYRWHPSSLNLNGLFMFLGRYLETERNIFTLRWGRPASCIFVLEYWLSWVIHGCKQKIPIDITHGQ